MEPSGVVCDTTCGCPVPCPGGVSCRCATMAAGVKAGDEQTSDHKKCPCGEHCGCNPCTCSTGSTITGTGKLYCKCGPGCTCATCTA